MGTGSSCLLSPSPPGGRASLSPGRAGIRSVHSRPPLYVVGVGTHQMYMGVRADRGGLASTEYVLPTTVDQIIIRGCECCAHACVPARPPRLPTLPTYLPTLLDISQILNLVSRPTLSPSQHTRPLHAPFAQHHQPVLHPGPPPTHPRTKPSLPAPPTPLRARTSSSLV